MAQKEAVLTSLEQLNVKVQIGTLLFDLFLNDNFVLHTYRGHTEQHDHPVYELQWIESGSGQLVVAGTEHPFEAGSLHLIGPYVPHQIRLSPHETIRRSTIRFMFQDQCAPVPWYPESEAKQLEAVLAPMTYCTFPAVEETGAIQTLLQMICREFEKPSLGSYTIVHSLFAQIIVQLVRAVSRQQGSDDVYTMPYKTKDDLRLQIIDEFFRRYQEELRIDMLADDLHVSEKQVNRLIRKYYRTSFKQKLIDVRVEVAKDLLRARSDSVEQIAEQVGYASKDHFTRVFVQRTGMMPTQYRKQSSKE